MRAKLFIGARGASRRVCSWELGTHFANRDVVSKRPRAHLRSLLLVAALAALSTGCATFDVIVPGEVDLRARALPNRDAPTRADHATTTHAHPDAATRRPVPRVLDLGARGSRACRPLLHYDDCAIVELEQLENFDDQR
jgi:hypothetical protein